MSLNFEQAWPHLREGKSFRFRHVSESSWSPWNVNLEGLGTVHLNYLLKCEFDIKREPREFTLNLRDRIFTEGNFGVMYNGTDSPPSRSDIIKVREVLDE